MDEAFSKRYRQLTLLDCIETTEKSEDPVGLKTPELQKNTGGSVVQPSAHDYSTLLDNLGGRKVSDITSKKLPRYLKSLCHGEGNICTNQADLLEVIDSDHQVNSAVLVGKDERMKTDMTGESSSTAFACTVDTSTASSGRNQPVASSNDSQAINVSSCSGMTTEVEHPVVVDLTRSPDTSARETNRTGIKRKRRRLYYSPRKRARSSPQKSSKPNVKSGDKSAENALAVDTAARSLCFDAKTEPSKDVESTEGVMEAEEEDCDSVGEETEYPMPATAQQKEQRRLYRMRQLKEMKARETMEARRERALKRRGEHSPSKKHLSTANKKVSWKEGGSLVSILNYEDDSILSSHHS